MLDEQDTKFAKNIISNWGRTTNPELAASNDAIFAQSKYYKISSVNVCASSMFARAHATESIHARSDTLVQRTRIMTPHTCITTLHILIITQRTSEAHTHNDSTNTQHNIKDTHHDTAHKWGTRASRHHTHAYHTITTVEFFSVTHQIIRSDSPTHCCSHSITLFWIWLKHLHTTFHDTQHKSYALSHLLTLALTRSPNLQHDAYTPSSFEIP